MLTDKTYSFNEMAEMFGMAPEPFKELMVEMGLLDETGRVTELALKNGLLVERLVPIDK
jgi:hypothetical protein